MTVTLTPAVDLSRVKMKWREVYVSEGLNKKMTPTQAPGIYRGLILGFDGTQGGGDRRVALTPDVSTGDHAAVYQTQDGFSLTYFDPAGSTIILDLASALLDSAEVVITMLMDYTVGVDTTAEFHAYTVADYNALTAGVRGELVVLGSVNVPVAATNVTAGMINFDRRTLAWEGQAKGAIPWTPLFRAPGFEWGTGVTASIGGLTTGDFTTAFWHIPVTSGSITLTKIETNTRSGGGAIELNYISTGVATARLQQHLMMPVEGGQLIKVKIWVDVLQVSTAGTLDLFWEFFDVGTGLVVWTNTYTIDTSGLTGGYVLVEKIAPVPIGGDIVISRAGILVNGLNVGSTGAAVRIDDFQMWLETLDVTKRDQTRDQRMGEVSAFPLVLEDPAVPEDDAAPILRFDSAAGQVIGQRKDRKDQDGSSSISPALNWFGRFVAGQGLLTSDTLANSARFTAVAGTATGIEFTLMWESVPSGEKGYRKYVSPTGKLVETVNAVYDNTTGNWSKDVNGEVAFRVDHSNAGTSRFSQIAGTNSWTDVSWVEDLISILGNLQAGHGEGAWGKNSSPGYVRWELSGATGDTLYLPILLQLGDVLDTVRFSYNSTDSAHDLSWDIVKIDQAPSGIVTIVVLDGPTIAAGSTLANFVTTPSLAHTVDSTVDQYFLRITDSDVGVTLRRVLNYRYTVVRNTA